MENTNKENRKEIDLLDIWRIALKRKWVIISAVLVILVITAVHLFTRVPLYKATATIIIENPSSNILDISETYAFLTGRNFKRTRKREIIFFRLSKNSSR